MIKKELSPAVIPVLVVNLLLLLIFFVFAAVVDIGLFSGLLVGWIIGNLNLLWMQRTVKKSFTVSIERISSHMVFRYYIRFGAVVTVLYLLVTQGAAEPVTLMTSFAVTTLSAITGLILALRKGLFNASYTTADIRS